MSFLELRTQRVNGTLLQRLRRPFFRLSPECITWTVIIEVRPQKFSEMMYIFCRYNNKYCSWTKTFGLLINPAKPQAIIIGGRYIYSGFDSTSHLKNHSVLWVPTYHSLCIKERRAKGFRDHITRSKSLKFSFFSD